MAADPPADPVETVRKLVVEIVEARGLVPKDGAGSSSPYVVIDFDGQRKRTRTLHRELNPVWNETLLFEVRGAKPQGMLQPPGAPGAPLELDVLHDRREVPGTGAGRRNHFLGRVRLDSRRFVRKGEEALMYFPLQKKSFFSWIRGDIGLKIYYVDVPVPVPVPAPEPPAPVDGEAAAAPPEVPAEGQEPAAADAPPPQSEAAEMAEAQPPPAEEAQPAAAAEAPPHENESQPPVPDASENVVTEAAPEPNVPPPDSADPPPPEAELHPPEPEEPGPPPPPPPPPPQLPPQPQQQLLRPPLPRAGKSAPVPDAPLERSSYDLVEKVQYLFVRVVRARGLPASASPHVRIFVHGRHANTQSGKKAAFFFDWDRTFAFPRRDAASAPDSPLEISVWDLPPDAEIPDDEYAGGKHFLGGVCFDTSEVPTRDPPDSPLATQWYKLEGGWARRGDLMLATWIGTQADESFHHAWKAGDGSNTAISAFVNSRSKIYVSPKLWYLRLTVIEAQDLLTFSAGNPAAPPMIRDSSPLSVKATVGFQTLRTRFASSRNGSPSWNEDLIFVAGEPFGDQLLVLYVESRQSKEQGATPLFGTAVIPLSTIERRVDDRLVASRWLAIDTPAHEKPGKRTTKGFIGASGAGRLHVRVCLDGGYHVADEPAHAASDYRPSARQLWSNPIGTVELGIIGCWGLLPMKTVQGKGATDAYAVAKYGSKWARTRTVTGTLDPAWNEQYTWEVYDPCTVITVGVFDDDAIDRQAADGQQKGFSGMSRAIGRVRIRISTLESRKPYRSTYPLLLLLPTGVKRMGDVELAVRFTRAVSSVDVVHLYSRPMLPAMHYVHPLPPPQRETLRVAAARIVAGHLSRSEPSLRREVVAYMLEAEAPPRFSMRKVRANWNRIAASLSWAADGWRWVENTRAWRNPTSTILAHAVLVLLVLFPDLIVPAVAFHVSAVGVWKYRGRPRGPAAQPGGEAPVGWSDYYFYHGGGAVGGAAGVVEELDEELDSVPSGKGHDVLRARYDRLRGAAARVQGLLGDVAAQGERIQALVAWRDPRATGIFVAMCFFISAVLYIVPMKMVVVLAGFYYLRHPVFRDRMPPPALNFFRRLPSLSDRFL